jgi:tetrahydromethanopterin S-methyltransferase subunit F
MGAAFWEVVERVCSRIALLGTRTALIGRNRRLVKGFRSGNGWHKE